MRVLVIGVLMGHVRLVAAIIAETMEPISLAAKS
jgi:hypothetical protein